MATIVNTPAASQQDSRGTGFLIGVLIIVCFIGILIFYGLPALRNMGPVQVNVPAPQVNVPAPQVNIPAPQVNVPAPIVPTK